MNRADAPRTKEAAAKTRYGSCSWMPRGTAYSPTRCAMEIPIGGRSVMFKQCTRKPVAGPDSLYCRMHANKLEEFRPAPKYPPGTPAHLMRGFDPNTDI